MHCRDRPNPQHHQTNQQHALCREDNSLKLLLLYSQRNYYAASMQVGFVIFHKWQLQSVQRLGEQFDFLCFLSLDSVCFCISQRSLIILFSFSSNESN